MYEIGKKELEAIGKVIESRKFFRYERGRIGTSDSFERAFEEKIGASHAVSVTTGTNALIAALGASGIGPGAEVLVPAYTFVATFYSVASVGAIPVLVNIDENLTMCPLDMMSKITPKTKAVIPVHMDGQAANMDAIVKIAKTCGLKVIEDTAQAIGGKYKGKCLGTIGDLGCFSFNQDKILSCGEGGAVVTSDPELYERCAFMQDGASLFTTQLWKDSKTAPFMGGAMRISEIQGAMLCVQLERLDGILERLRERKSIWIDVLGESEHWKIIRGHDIKGDCGTSVVISFSHRMAAGKAAKILEMNTVNAVQLLERRGHAFWEWIELFENGKMTHNPRLNPLHMSLRSNPYRFETFLPTVDILQKALKINVNYDLTVQQTRTLATKVRESFELFLAKDSSKQKNHQLPSHQQEFSQETL